MHLGPAPESLTDKIYANTCSIAEYTVDDSLGVVDLSVCGSRTYGGLQVEIIDSTDDYLSLMRSVFDFDRLRTFIKANPSFKFLFDSMNGGALVHFPA